MLRKFSTSRTLADNIKLGVLTAFTAGMVNIASLLMFFAFSSNVTGHYAILASEIVKGDYYQVGVVAGWIFLFFFGGFLSNTIIIKFNERYAYAAHAAPLILEILCLTAVGVYCGSFYKETLIETEMLISLMSFAMGLQNGLTASISNFSVKTTHLTGLTTDLGILTSMLLHPRYREDKELRGKVKLLLSIAGSYLAGATIAGVTYYFAGYRLFYLISTILLVVIAYEFYKIRIARFLIKRSHATHRTDLKMRVAGG